MISKNKKELLVAFVNGYCEICHKKFDIKDLQIHRIKRGYMNGSYDCFRNLQVLCVDCHKKIHSQEKF
jgi:hypothetical protein